MPTHYDALQTTAGASDADIKKAYRKFALTHHPDKTLHLPDAERKKREHAFKLATTAYEVLSDGGKRATYDRNLRSSSLPHTGAYTQQQRDKQRRQQAQPKSQAPPPKPTPPPKPAAPPPQPQWTPPPRTFSVSAFSSGSPRGTFPASTWHYHAPVSEDSSRTILSYTNAHGWAFSIAVSKKFKLTQRPVVPQLEQDTRGEICIRLRMVRDDTAKPNGFMKEVVVDMKSTPGGRQTALSSMLIESRDSVILRITLATAHDAALLASPAWTWAFDADQGFLGGTLQTYRVTHLMFWPSYPAHVVLEGGEVPEKEPFPPGTPMEAVKAECPAIRFCKLSRQFYCSEQVWAGKKLWRVAAVGIV